MKKKIVPISLVISIILNLLLLILLKYTSSVDLYFSFIDFFKAVISPIVTLAGFLLAYKIWHNQKKKEVISLECKNLYFTIYSVEKFIKKIEDKVKKSNGHHSKDINEYIDRLTDEIENFNKQCGLCCELLKNQELKSHMNELNGNLEYIVWYHDERARIVLGNLSTEKQIQDRLRSYRVELLKEILTGCREILISYISFSKSNESILEN